MKKLYLLIVLVVFIFGASACESKSDFEDFELFHSGLLAAQFDNKWGYLDKKGKVVIEFLYDRASAFHNDTAVVESNKEMFVINTKGKNILDKKYQAIYRDVGTNLIFYKMNDRWGLMDKKGKKLTESLYDRILPFAEDRAMVRLNDLFGFMDKKGKIVIPIEYDEAYSFSNGVAAVKEKNKYGFINTSGKISIDFLYDKVTSFDLSSRSIVFLASQMTYHLIDKSGKILISGDGIESDNGPVYAVKKADIVKLYDKDGKSFNNYEYNRSWYLDGYTMNLEYANGEDMNVWFNEDGTVFKESAYDDSDFSFLLLDGQPPIFIEYDDDYVDVTTKKENHRIKCDSLTQMLSNGRFIVERNDRYGVINKQGDVEIEFFYDVLWYLNDGYYLYVVNNLGGLLGKNKETIISATYEAFYFFPNIYNI